MLCFYVASSICCGVKVIHSAHNMILLHDKFEIGVIPRKGCGIFGAISELLT